MKRTKKWISILLTAVMLMTSFSAAFTAFAASGVTEEQWNALVQAMQNESVAGAVFSGSQNAYTVQDSDGSVLAAARAFWTVFGGLCDINADQNNTNRTVNQVKNQIANELNARMTPADFSAYQVDRVLTGFIAGANVSPDSSTSQMSPVTVRLTVNCAESILLEYPTLDDLPDTVATAVVFEAVHSQKDYKVTTGSGCSSTTTTYYYLALTSVSQSQSGAMDKAVFLQYRSTLEKYGDLFESDMQTLTALGSASITRASQELGEVYDSVCRDFSVKVWAHFFGQYDVPALTANLDTAYQILMYTEVAGRIEQAAQTDYSDYTSGELEALYAGMAAEMESYDAAPEAVRAYIEAHGFDRAKMLSMMDDIRNAMELALLKELKAQADAASEQYGVYDEDAYLAGDITAEQLNVAAGEIKGYLDALASYKPENILAVCGEGYVQSLQELYDTIRYVLTVHDCKMEFQAEYAYYVQTVYQATNLEDSSEQLLAAVKDYDEWYSGLKDCTEKIRDAVGEKTAEKIFAALNGEMTAHMDSRYAALYTRIQTETQTAAELYDAIQSHYGEAVTIGSLSSYARLEQVLGFVEHDIYDFLAESENFDLPASFVRQYESLSRIILDDYRAFRVTGGFDRFETAEIPDIVRLVSTEDIARNRDYTVSDDKVEEIIVLLDRFLSSQEFKTLAGDVDIQGTVTGLLDALYSDDVINAVLQYVYPIVANEFVKVWATLPDTITISGVDTGILGLKADVDCALDLYSVEDAMESIGLYLFPKTLANAVRDEYPQVAAVLQQAVSAASEENNPWEDDAICDPETGKLALDWGVHDRESFVNAASAALSGLEPLLMALLCNQPMHLANKIGTGSGSAKVSFITLNLTVDPIELVLTASANAGYNNAVAPILEALEIAAPDGNQFACVRDVLEQGLLNPVEQFLEKLGSAPVSVIAAILPNLAYAAAAGLIEPLLGMLKTDIEYTTNAKYDAQVTSGSLADVYQSEEPIAINLQDMIDLSSLGVSVSDFESLFGMVTDLLGVQLPMPDYAAAACMGELIWNDTVRSEKTYAFGVDGKAAHIQANKADVLLFVLRYLLNALATDPGLIDSLAAAFGAGEPVELPDAVRQLLDNLTSRPDDAIAAVAELALPMEHDAPGNEINWISGAKKASVTYSQYWTKEKAEYVADNLPGYIDNVLMILGVTVNGVKVESLAQLLQTVISDLYRAETLNSLAAQLAEVFASVQLGGLGDILKEQIGLDFAYWNHWNADFADGDKQAFAAALGDLFAPFETILGCLLCGQDLSITITDEIGTDRLICLKGSQGYAYGVIPILEALGAQGVLSPEAYAADTQNRIANIVTPLLSVLDQAEQNPYGTVLELLPNLLYFTASGGLEVALNNILNSVYLALDTIRPIYDVDLNALVGMDLRFAENDPVSFLFTAVSGLLYEKTGFVFRFDFTAEQLLQSLAFGDVTAYVSANGRTAYRLSGSSDCFADILTVILRYVIGEVVFSENALQIADLAKEQFGLSDEMYAFLYALLKILPALHDTHPDYVLGIVFWIFYGADTAADAVAEYYEYMRYDWAELIDLMASSDIPYIQKAGMLMRNVYQTTFVPLFDRLADEKDLPIHSEDISGFIQIFRDFIDLIKQMFETLKRLFSGLS